MLSLAGSQYTRNFLWGSCILSILIKRNSLSWTVEGRVAWGVLKFPYPAFFSLQVKWLIAVQISTVVFKSIYIKCFFSKWWNVYSVSIISSDCTLKIPTKCNQTKLFFFSFLYKCVASQLYIQSWFSFVLKRVGWLHYLFFPPAAAWCVFVGCGLVSWGMRAPRLTSGP